MGENAITLNKYTNIHKQLRYRVLTLVLTIKRKNQLRKGDIKWGFFVSEHLFAVFYPLPPPPPFPKLGYIIHKGCPL